MRKMAGRRRATDCAAISRKMNAINKVGRPIIPSRSSDESFFIGSGARKSDGGERAGEKQEEKDENEDTRRRVRDERTRKRGNLPVARGREGRVARVRAVCNQI